MMMTFTTNRIRLQSDLEDCVKDRVSLKIHEMETVSEYKIWQTIQS
jgi:hypothetical protein